MLKVKALPDVLGKVLQEGIHASILMTTNGGIIGVAKGSSTPNPVNEDVVSAMVSNIFSECARSGTEDLDSGDLGNMILDLEGATVVVASCGVGYLVCLCAEPSFPVGHVMAKLSSIGNVMKDTLSQLEV
mmetsp:Transcript_18305/g.34493  ORF Transcript_18305/g.34493 Transcript_18305/m.34493 type:complete len:130 (-) Transcript_18305:53-442(-)